MDDHELITARAAARIMVEQGSGVTLTRTSGLSAGTNPTTGGMTGTRVNVTCRLVPG
jgi:hypothetical protein